MCSTMATATPSKSQTQMELFLPAPTTLERSCTLTKKLTGMCVSTIAYQRNLFDEQDFALKSFRGVDIRVVKGTSKNSAAVQCLSNWLVGAFDALEKKFLKQMTFEITSEKGILLETYCFHYSYKNSTLKTSIDGSEEAVLDAGDINSEQIRNLLQNLLVATSVALPLPPKCTTSVKLSYYEGTPENYEPPGFKPYTGDGKYFDQPLDVSTFSLGKVFTSFHTFKVKCKHATRNRDSGESGSQGIVCPCGLMDDATQKLLKCEKCHTLQHMACFKVFSEGESLSQRTHHCLKCSPKSFEDFNPDECIFRRVMSHCLKSASVSIRKLMIELGLDGGSAVLNIRRLFREGVLQKCVQPVSLDKPDFLYNVNKNKLILLKPKYFY